MKSSSKDELQGAIHDVKGKAKKQVGKLTNNPNLQAKGQSEETAGKIQRKIGQVKRVFGK